MPTELSRPPDSTYVRTYITTVLFLLGSQLPDRIQYGSPTFSRKGPHPLLWTGLRAARGKITIIGVPNCQNYCEIFIVRTQFTHVAAGFIIQGDPWYTALHRCPVLGHKLQTRIKYDTCGVLGPRLQVHIQCCTVVRFYQLSYKPHVTCYCCLVSSHTSPYEACSCCPVRIPVTGLKKGLNCCPVLELNNRPYAARQCCPALIHNYSLLLSWFTDNLFAYGLIRIEQSA